MKSKHKSESVIDYLNKCDEAISAIIDEAPFDDQMVHIPDTIQYAKPTNNQVLENNFEMNMLDSLREELLKEEEFQD